MKSELVVKSNQVIEASYRLSVVEQRVILSAIAKIPKMCEISDDEIYTVSVQDIRSLGIHEKTAYRDLKEAVSRLYDRSISLNMDEKLVKMRWVQRVEFTDNQGIIALRFSKDILPFISNLKENFTQYLLSEVAKMQGVYSVRIYELLLQYKNIGERVINIDDFRVMLDLGQKYNTTGNLIAWVINPAVDEINQLTDLKINAKTIKTGRKFTHVKFTIRGKSQLKGVNKLDKDKHVSEEFYEMTDSQINSFANQLARLPDLSNLAIGNESFDALASRIKDMLRSSTKQKQFIPYLKKLGFKAHQD